MSKFLYLAAVVATAVGVSGSAQAQTVAMYGEYSETNGTVVKIPQNPPNVLCPPQDVPANPRDARCHFIHQTTGGVLNKNVWEKPIRGNGGARNIPTAPGDADNDGLDVGDPFILPPLFAHQEYGRQGGVVIGDDVRWLDTTFNANAPATHRESYVVGATSVMVKTIPALTRHFSSMNWTKAGNGHNDGILLSTTALGDKVYQAERPAPHPINNTVTATDIYGGDVVQVTYTLGPREFGGTMANLLDGDGHLFIRNSVFTGFAPAAAPIVATYPLGDGIVGNFRNLNANGWDFTGVGGQRAGEAYGLVLHPGFVPPTCDNQGNPVGCNVMKIEEIQQGIPLFPLSTATSFKHKFPLTTGTVSIVRTGPRGGGVQIQTNTGMGYDTVMGGERNVGLVAGSYTTRHSATSDQINVQVMGWKLKFTPEPGATAALASGIGLLGLLGHAARRRS